MDVDSQIEKQSRKDSQARSYCFTINNYDEYGYPPEKVEAVLQSFPSMHYYIFSLEVGLENQTPHIQGYFYAKNPIKFSTLLNKFEGSKAHFEVAKGTAEENKNYICKSDKWEDTVKAETSTGVLFEWGTLPVSKQGKRTDWEAVKVMVQNNQSDFAIIEDFPHMIPHLKKIQEYRNLVLEQYIDNQIVKDPAPENWIIFGPPECGKSTFAWNSAPRPEIYTVTNSIKPFDSFQAGKHTTIILDEFDDCNFDIRDINQWFDKFYQKFHCRYYDRWLTQSRNIIISNKRPENFWKEVQRFEPLVWQAFCRRITRVLEFYALGKYNEYNGMNDYLLRNDNSFHPLPEGMKSPFEEDK